MKCKSLNKKKVLVIIKQISLGSRSAISTSTMSLINPSIGIVLTSSTAFLTSKAISITNEYISKFKITIFKIRRLDYSKYFTIWEDNEGF